MIIFLGFQKERLACSIFMNQKYWAVQIIFRPRHGPLGMPGLVPLVIGNNTREAWRETLGRVIPTTEPPPGGSVHSLIFSIGRA